MGKDLKKTYKMPRKILSRGHSTTSGKYRKPLFLIKILLALTILLTQPAFPDELSTPLRMSIDGCKQSQNHKERLACILMLHDSLCYESVMSGALDLADDRSQCTKEIDNPILKDYLDKALLESKDNPVLQIKMQSAYSQWQHNIQNIKPRPLEPEYQYKVRRDTDHQALAFRLISVDANE